MRGRFGYAVGVKNGSPYKLDDDARVVLDSIRRIVQALRVSDLAAERAVGISGAQLFVLEKLAAAAGPLSVGELAEQTLTHQSSVSVVVQKLEQQGLVHRSRGRRDARRVELSLPARARRLLEKAPRAVQQRMVHAIAAMPARHRRQMAELLGALAVEVAGEARPQMFFEDSRSKRDRQGSVRGD